MQQHIYGAGRDNTRLRRTRSDIVPGRKYAEPLYPSQSEKISNPLKKVRSLLQLRRPLPAPRCPIFWSYYSPRAKHLYLQKMARAALQTNEPWLLRHKAEKFDFIGQIAAGKTLLVGEGNLSFTLSLAKDARINPLRLTSSTYEVSSELSDEAKENAKRLRSLGALVLHHVDATRLSSIFEGSKFDSIIFQFPHTGSREPAEGHNPNFILVRDFLRSAARQLEKRGKVLISAVDSPHYRGAFQFEEAAKLSGFLPPESYAFDPDNFQGYHHTMTHQPGSALDDHDEFATWVFRPKA
ncbi:MAG: class I SAM-dependent methyltransferase [Alphaproteobacteria bacterium]